MAKNEAMEIHKVRLLDHLHLRVADLTKSRRFYAACLGALGKSLDQDTASFFTCDELFVCTNDSGPSSRIHFAFQASDQTEVQAFYRAALEAGGTDNGLPGPRNYHPGYYAAYVLDPDGNNIEAVFHGPVTRSAESVVFMPEAF